MGKVNLQWAGLAFIVIIHDAEAYKNRKKPGYQEYVMKNIHFAPKNVHFEKRFFNFDIHVT